MENYTQQRNTREEFDDAEIKSKAESRKVMWYILGPLIGLQSFAVIFGIAVGIYRCYKRFYLKGLARARVQDWQNDPQPGQVPQGQIMMAQGQRMMPQAQGVMMFQQSGYGYQSVPPIQPIKDDREQQKVQQPQAAPTALPPPPRPV